MPWITIALITLFTATPVTPDGFNFNAPLPAIAQTAPCTPGDATACATETYNRITQGNHYDYGDLLAMTYHGELALFDIGGHSGIAREALARSFFDRQTGACPNGEGCTPGRLIAWLATLEAWRYPGHTGRLLGGAWRSYADYRQAIVTDTTAHFDQWRTGQGGGVPSLWGNRCLQPGTARVRPNKEQMAALIVHTWADGSYSFNTALRDGELPQSSLLAVITTTEGRFAVGLCRE